MKGDGVFLSALSGIVGFVVGWLAVDTGKHFGAKEVYRQAVETKSGYWAADTNGQPVFVWGSPTDK